MNAATDERLGLPSASSFERDALCPGNRNLIRAMFDASAEDFTEESSEFAVRGRRIHKAREMSNTFELEDESELRAYQTGMALENSLLQNWVAENGIIEYTEGQREQRLWLNHPDTMAPMLSGQLDVNYLAGSHGLVVDWKSGLGKACGPANTSWQLRIQALLLSKEHDELRTIRAAFVKPETWGDQLDYVTFTAFDLANIERYVHFILWQTQQKDAPLKAGEHCKWCPAKAVCEAAVREAMMPTLVVPQPTPEVVTPKVAAELVKLAPLEVIREVWGKRTAVKNIMDAIAARLCSLPKEEQYRLWLKLKPGKTTQRITDMKAVFIAFRRAGYPASEIWKALRLNKEDATTMIQQHLNCRDAEAEATFNMITGDYTETNRGEQILGEA